MQDIDTGSVCMQAWADRAAISETLLTGKATFYSRSRKERWCKGETSGNYINVRFLCVACCVILIDAPQPALLLRKRAYKFDDDLIGLA
jgi:phosphoribosyl-AMP cyclohydrolase